MPTTPFAPRLAAASAVPAALTTLPVPAVLGALAVLAALALPGPAAAQTRTCNLVRGGTMNQFTSAGIGVVRQFGGPVVFTCGGDVLIQSARATVLESRGEVRLEGDVLYRDSTQELRTDWLQRRAREGFMLARGSVVMRDRASGSEIRGAQMTRRDRAGSPTETVVTGRPHATLYREQGDDAPADALGSPAGEGAPIEVDSDSIVLVGSDVFRALGNATFERGVDLSGSGDVLEFDDATGLLSIDGNARVDGARFDLSGERVEALTVEGAVREVAAFGDAVLEGEQVYLEAPEVYMYFERELLQSLEARGRAPRVVAAPPAADDGAPGADDAAGAGPPRPAAADSADAGAPPAPARLDPGRRAPGRAGAEPGAVLDAGARAGVAAPGAEVPGAVPGDEADGADADPPLVFARAEGLEVRADSLHVRSPDERIEVLTAVGLAHGVRVADAAAAAALPEGFRDEWVRGDTVVARFADPDTVPEGADPTVGPEAAEGGAEPAAASGDAATGQPERVLERLEAVGHGPPASALSHTAEDTPGEYTLNYLIARRIVMLVRGGEAREVQAEGTLRGVYLTPDGSVQATPAEEQAQPAQPPPPAAATGGGLP